MIYLLDTDTVSRLQRGNTNVLRQLSTHDVTQIKTTAITLYEIMRGRFAYIDQARSPAQEDWANVSLYEEG